jgi:hypothetical protein
MRIKTEKYLELDLTLNKYDQSMIQQMKTVKIHKES